MFSGGCLSGSLSYCVCSSGLTNQSLSSSCAQSSAGHSNCTSAERFCHLRSVHGNACFIGKSGRGWKSVDDGKLYTPRSVGNETVRASRADPTLNIEASDRKSSEQSTAVPPAQSHLDLLERFTSESNANTGGRTIAQQLEGQVDLAQAEEVTVPLIQSTSLEAAPLSISQKRNIRRQKYLDEVAKRNDAPFFTTVALFVILPPTVILGVAVATGHVQLFP